MKVRGFDSRCSHLLLHDKLDRSITFCYKRVRENSSSNPSERGLDTNICNCNNLLLLYTILFTTKVGVGGAEAKGEGSKALHLRKNKHVALGTPPNTMQYYAK